MLLFTINFFLLIFSVSVLTFLKEIILFCIVFIEENMIIVDYLLFYLEIFLTILNLDKTKSQPKTMCRRFGEINFLCCDFCFSLNFIHTYHPSHTWTYLPEKWPNVKLFQQSWKKAIMATSQAARYIFYHHQWVILSCTASELISGADSDYRNVRTCEPWKIL